LETKLVGAGQYKYNKDLLDLTFEKKWAFSTKMSIFSKEAYQNAFYNDISTLKNVRGPHLGAWRAACGPRAGRCPGLF